MAVSGKVAGTKENLRLDLDVIGDQLDWEELRRIFGGGGKQRQQEKVGAESYSDDGRHDSLQNEPLRV